MKYPPAGRLLDALVGEKVIGRFSDHPYPYSSYMEFAFEVSDKLFELGWDIEIQIYKDDEKKKMYRVVVNEQEHQENGHVEFSESWPEALCLVALRAVGQKDGN